MDEDEVILSPQRKLHIYTEALSVFVAAPFLIWVATREEKLTKTEKGLLLAFATASIIIDGYLLTRFLGDKPQKALPEVLPEEI